MRRQISGYGGHKFHRQVLLKELTGLEPRVLSQEGSLNQPGILPPVEGWKKSHSFSFSGKRRADTHIHFHIWMATLGWRTTFF